MTLQNYFFAILFCISIVALVLAILAYTKKKHEQYSSKLDNTLFCQQPPMGGVIQNYNNVPLLSRYGSQRIFF